MNFIDILNLIFMTINIFNYIVFGNVAAFFIGCCNAFAAVFCWGVDRYNDEDSL